MHLSLIGINHSTAPVWIREKVAITSEQLDDSLSLLSHHVSAGIILSTCNRTEVYATDNDVLQSKKASLHFLEAHLNVSDADYSQHLYTCEDEMVVEHLFRVASGLDSMIIGEFEILGQVKQALESAERAEMVNLPLRHLFQSAIRAGRQVREETGISKNALSVSSVAVDLASRIVDDLKGCKMLVVGAGEAGRLVAKVAKERGISQIVVASRSQETASVLAAALGGSSVTLGNLLDELSTAHIVVTCTGAPSWILLSHQVSEVMRLRPELPMVIIDIGVPRNVEPTVSQINNVFLYNIDDLTEISDRNRQQRESEILMVKKIVAVEIDKFLSWWQAFEVRPVISCLMQKAEDIRRTQLSRTLNKLPNLSGEERDYLEAMTKSIVTKILKDPLSYLKANANGHRDWAKVISELFQLDTPRRE